MIDFMAEIAMTVFKPARRTCYVMRWSDPTTHQRREKTTGKAGKRDALKVAAELARQIYAGEHRDKMDWDAFSEKYLSEQLSRRSAGTRQAWRTVRYWLGQFREPRWLSDITTAYVAEWQVFIGGKMASTTAGGYSARLRAAMRWAAEQELIAKAPVIHCRGGSTARARGITGEELDRMLDATGRLRPRDWQAWQRFLRGLWESGFRIGELRRISWDRDAEITFDLSNTYPVVTFAAGSHKARRVHVQVVTPEFWQLCCETPETDRHGLVFFLDNGKGEQISLKRICRRISDIGREARVITNAETGKWASAHDFRRAFARRIKAKVPREEVKKWTRHQQDQTLDTYYLQLDAQELAARLWEESSQAAMRTH
ncbi:MAG: tyrosine-type recombinase/integrase [Planctomycetaceae bacterium]|nr:tyrosine-type recombinase/integrase [Planctomycetaceae bacterium]